MSRDIRQHQMSREVQQHHIPDIRNTPLDQFEKKELTHYLKDLKLCPQSGKVVIHFNAGIVYKVEPQPLL